ncbi:MAG TPA: lysophospholipid acyltransferase family protein [Opitutaceae bacterium]|nr:lysophospholipid acyltransferase family protein [Opitutaceae bacterium]
MITALQSLGYYLTLFLFTVVALALNLACLLFGWIPPSDRAERFFQRLIHRHFALFVWWISLIRLFRIEYTGRVSETHDGLVLVANHPGLLDITYLLARMPEAVCIFKPAIRRNPLLGAAARRAGYLASDGGHELVRNAAAKVAAGHRLILFPEGTRTPHGESPQPFRPGFALIAARAATPVQLVRIACDSNVLTRGRPWWRMPELPARVEIEFGPVLTSTGADWQVMAREVDAWFAGQRTVLARNGRVGSRCRLEATGTAGS